MLLLLLVDEGGARGEGGNCLHLAPGTGPAEVALREKRGQGGPEHVWVWLLGGGHQRDGEELEGAGRGRLGRKLHPGGSTTTSCHRRRHGSHPWGDGYHTSHAVLLLLLDHSAGVVEVLEAWPLLGRKRRGVAHIPANLFVLLSHHFPYGLADLSLLVGLEESQVVGGVRRTDGGHREELEGRGREARRWARRAGREGVGGVHGAWGDLGEERGQREGGGGSGGGECELGLQHHVIVEGVVCGRGRGTPAGGQQK